MNFFIVALTTFLLSACSGSVKPVVHTDSPGVTSVGQQVTLDASKTVYDRDSTYTWTIDSAPYDSEATIDSLHARTTTFTPDQPGRYEITITVANDDWDDFETMILTVIPELADGVTEVGVLVIHDADTIFGWQIGRSIDEAADIISLEYPSLVEGWEDGSVAVSLINVPIDDTQYPDLYQVVDWEVSQIEE